MVNKSLEQARQKYWAYALPIIRKAQSDSRLFKNVKALKRNYIRGCFGKGGFYICCVANISESRVEMVLDTGSAMRNKNAFYSLNKLKTDIESELGITLNWNPKNQKDMATMTIDLKNVDVRNEQDWSQMAGFHAEWTRKFHDVIAHRIEVLGL